MTAPMNRREAMMLGSAAVGASSLAPQVASAADKTDRPADEPFGYCLNMATIMGQKLTLTEQIDVAAKAGYKGIEPWIGDIEKFVESGGKLSDAASRIRDAGLTVESAIGFAQWIVDDDARRTKGLEDAKKAMDLVHQLDGRRIAAPPAGAPNDKSADLARVAERYRALLELGDRMDVVPQLEVWGHSRWLGRLAESTAVAIDAGHPRACLLPDIYHLYKGGSDFNGLRLFGPLAIHVFHVNDYPGQPARSSINDSHRVYPGDGIAPSPMIYRTLRDIGFRGMLSLELFNREYWAQDALTVAKTGLEKTRAVVRRSLA